MSSQSTFSETRVIAVANLAGCSQWGLTKGLHLRLDRGVWDALVAALIAGRRRPLRRV